jgi:hypothetical protein
MEAPQINTRPHPSTRPHPVSRYLKVCRFLKYFGREYPPTSRLLLLANTEDNLSIDDLRDITGAAITPLIQNLARLAREGLVTYYESEAFRFKRSLSGVNYSFRSTTTIIPDSCWNLVLSSPCWDGVVAGRAGAQPRRGGAEGLPATTDADLCPRQAASLLSGAGSRFFLASSIR